MSSSIVPTSNYRYSQPQTRNTRDPWNTNPEEEVDGDLTHDQLDQFGEYQGDAEYEAQRDHDMMLYDAGNSYMVPFSKRDSDHYDTAWTEWRHGKPHHSKEWPSSMYFAEQLTNDEAYAGAKAASWDQFWGYEDPWDYYKTYEGTSHEMMNDFVVDGVQIAKNARASKNVYQYDPASAEDGVSSADLADGALYARDNDVRVSTGRERFIRLTEKTTPTVFYGPPSANRVTEGRPVIEYLKTPNLPTDQVVRNDEKQSATTNAPPASFDFTQPFGVRQNHLLWASDFGQPDGGYIAGGDSCTLNDMSQGMHNRAQMRIPTMLGLPTQGVPGEGDTISNNLPYGERRQQGDTHMSSRLGIVSNPSGGGSGYKDEYPDNFAVGGRIRHANKYMSLWGNNAAAPEPTAGWRSRPDDIVRDGRMRHANPFLDWYGANAGAPEPTAGWGSLPDDITSDGRMRHANKFLNWWGANAGAPESSAGWKTRVDDITADGRMRHANAFLDWWGANAGAPESSSGWYSRPDDIMRDGRIRAGAIHSIFGANAAYPNTTGDAVSLNNPINGARISDRKSLTNIDYLVPKAPETTFGGLNVNQTIPESLGRIPPTIAITGNKGALANIFDGSFSVGDIYSRLREEWSRVGVAGGSMTGGYLPQDNKQNHLTNADHQTYISNEPHCLLVQSAMRGLGSKTLCDRTNGKAFDDLSPMLLW